MGRLQRALGGRQKRLIRIISASLMLLNAASCRTWSLAWRNYCALAIEVADVFVRSTLKQV